jgi:uncharacterized membrane protein
MAHPESAFSKSELRGLIATALTMIVLDLVWLGGIARSLYQDALGHLMRPQAYWPAALVFYLGYVLAVWTVAVKGRQPGEAGRRGAAMGAYAYGVYELTNWAVLRDWPAWIVPIDWLWGTVLTGLAGAAGGYARRAGA